MVHFLVGVFKEIFQTKNQSQLSVVLAACTADTALKV
jgi:hypothetical protein